MKLDRNINADGKGKYALIKLRTALIRVAANPGLMEFSRADVDFGDTPETDFFVIRLKDKYAGAALHAYAEAAKADDLEYATEIDALAQAADRRMPKHMPD